MKKKLLISVCILVILMTFSSCYENSPINISQGKENKTLASWNENSGIKNFLISYAEDVTNEESANFVPEEDRIAVFDLDGTILSENIDGRCFMEDLFYYRINEDPGYNMTPELKAIVESQEELFGTKESWENWSEPFKGLDSAAYDKLVKDFREKNNPDFEELKYKDSFFKPMIELIEYLNEKNFKVYIVTGSCRDMTRALIEDIVAVENDRVIGTDYKRYVEANQSAGNEYEFEKTDKIVRGRELEIDNVNLNKVLAIDKEIGEKPILAFGNSQGDYSMLEYTLSNGKYRTSAFVMNNDDPKRSNGYEEGNESLVEKAKESGFNIISIKNDFDKVFMNEATE